MTGKEAGPVRTRSGRRRLLLLSRRSDDAAPSEAIAGRSPGDARGVCRDGHAVLRAVSVAPEDALQVCGDGRGARADAGALLVHVDARAVRVDGHRAHGKDRAVLRDDRGALRGAARDEIDLGRRR